MKNVNGICTFSGKCGSSEILDAVYDLPEGEKKFIKFCEDILKVNIHWDKTEMTYYVEQI